MRQDTIATFLHRKKKNKTQLCPLLAKSFAKEERKESGMPHATLGYPFIIAQSSPVNNTCSISKKSTDTTALSVSSAKTWVACFPLVFFEPSLYGNRFLKQK